MPFENIVVEEGTEAGIATLDSLKEKASLEKTFGGQSLQQITKDLLKDAPRSLPPKVSRAPRPKIKYAPVSAHIIILLFICFFFF